MCVCVWVVWLFSETSSAADEYLNREREQHHLFMLVEEEMNSPSVDDVRCWC